MRSKKCVAGLLALSLIFGVAPVMPVSVKAAETTELKVVYEYAETAEEETYSEYLSKYWGKGTDIVFDGVEGGFAYENGVATDVSVNATDEYLFGGFYKVLYDYDTDPENPSITGVEKLDIQSDLGEKVLCVKWIPASMLSIKAQNNDDVSAQSSDAKIRIVSGLDSLKYSAVGLDYVVLDTNRTNEMKTVQKTSVYSSMLAKSKTVLPSTMFGTAANYFIVFAFDSIPDKGFDKAIYARPWIKTADGTKVYGLARHSRIEDGFASNEYVNVPVNFKPYAKESGAAGVLELKYDTSKFTFHGFDEGQVFEEMDYNNDTTNGVVKIVGNVKDIQNNKALNDLFANVRFERKSGATITPSKEVFEVQSLDFCDKDEKNMATGFTIWNVRY